MGQVLRIKDPMNSERKLRRAKMMEIKTTVLKEVCSTVRLSNRNCLTPYLEASEADHTPLKKMHIYESKKKTKANTKMIS